MLYAAAVVLSLAAPSPVIESWHKAVLPSFKLAAKPKASVEVEGHHRKLAEITSTVHFFNAMLQIKDVAVKMKVGTAVGTATTVGTDFITYGNSMSGAVTMGDSNKFFGSVDSDTINNGWTTAAGGTECDLGLTTNYAPFGVPAPNVAVALHTEYNVPLGGTVPSTPLDCTDPGATILGNTIADPSTTCGLMYSPLLKQTTTSTLELYARVTNLDQVVNTQALTMGQALSTQDTDNCGNTIEVISLKPADAFALLTSGGSDWDAAASKSVHPAAYLTMAVGTSPFLVVHGFEGDSTNPPAMSCVGCATFAIGTPAADSDGDPCFPAGARLTKADGTAVLVEDLQEGDEVMAASADGTVTTDTVSLLSLAAPSSASAAFLTLTTAAKANLTLTPTHHVAVGAACCSELKQAKDVHVGETVWVRGKSGAATATTVTKTAATAKTGGKFSPVLANGGFPIVDQVVTSFDSIGKVTAASYGLPLLLRACKATGMCDLLRRTLFEPTRKYIDAH